MANITSTVEFYFSDSNLLTDVYLHGIISKDEAGWVKFTELLKFPKLRRLVTKQVNEYIKNNEGCAVDDDTKAKYSRDILADHLEKSSQLEVSRQSASVRRATDRKPLPYMPKENEPLVHLVLDSGGLIHSTPEELRRKAINFWTIPEVLNEVRDKKTRERLDNLPFELHTKEPSDEAMKFVVEFSKQSGEYGTLSLVDLKVLALAYMLEKQESGSNHLRTEPLNKKPTAAKPTPNRVVAASAKPTSAAAPQPTSPPSLQPTMEPAQPVTAAPMTSTSPLNDTTLVAIEENGKAPREVQLEAEDSNSPIENEEDQINKENAEEDEEDEEEEAEEEEENDEEEDEDSSIEDLGSDDDWDPSNLTTDFNANRQKSSNDNDNDRFANADDSEEDEQNVEIEEDDIDDNDEFDDKLFHGSAVKTSNNAKNASFLDSLNKGEESEPFNCTDNDFPTLGPSGGGSTGGIGSGWGSKPALSVVPGVAGSTVQPMSWHKQANFRSDTVTKIGSFTEQNQSSALNASSTLQAKKLGASSGDESRPNTASSSSRLIGAGTAAGMSSGKDLMEEDDGVGWFSPESNKSDVLDPFKPSALSSSNGSTPPSGGDMTSDMKKLNVSSSGETAVSSENKTNTSNENKPKQKNGNKKNNQNKGIQGMCVVARAGCITTDFAMQSVLIQIGLRLISVDGFVVRKIQQFVLRCNACFMVQQDTAKMFCERCGSSHLSRVACSIDRKTGKQQLHLKKDYKYKLQGTQYSLPKPGTQKKGRFKGEVVLREDQMMMGIWAQKTAPKAKEKTSMFGAEVNEKTGVSVRKSATTVVVGYGRTNPNAAKGRERRGKKKRSTK